MLVLDGKTLVYDRPFSHDGINYPANWLRLTTLAEKEAIGIVEQPDPATQGYDQRFWWGVDNPKDLDDLKTLWKDKTAQTAGSLLKPSDWYAIRKADTGAAIPTDWSDWRQSIRVAASTKETAIDAVTTVAELETYIKTTTGGDSDYSVWPLNPDDVAAQPAEEEVTSESESESVVSGALVSEEGVDTVDLGG